MIRFADPFDVLFDRIEVDGRRVLDVGCGSGGLVAALQERGAEVVGLEPNPVAAAQARDIAPASTIVEGAAERLEFDDDSFDIVIFFNSLHHCRDMGAALAEAQRVLRAGGIVYVAEPVAHGPMFEICKPVVDETEVRHDAQRAIEASGLHVACEDGYYFMTRYMGPEHLLHHLLGVDDDRAEAVRDAGDRVVVLFDQHAVAADDGFDIRSEHRVHVLTPAPLA